MVDVRGDVLRPPHGTPPAAVKSNKNQKWDPLRAMKHKKPKHSYKPTIYLPSHLPTCVPIYQHSYLPTHTYIHIYIHTYLPTHTYIILLGSFLSYPTLPFLVPIVVRFGMSWSLFRSVSVPIEVRSGTQRSPFRYFRRSVSVRSGLFR